MRFPWRNRKTETPQPDLEQSKRDLEQARRDLERTRAETPYYRNLGRANRSIRVQNHLAETFIVAAQGRHRG